MTVEGVYAFALFAIGTVLFPGAFWLQLKFWRSTSLGQSIAKRNGFNDKDIVDISNKLVSAFQAVLAAVSSFFILKHCSHDVLHARHDAALGYSWLGIPYFVYDTLCMFYVDRVVKGAPVQCNLRTVKDFFGFVIRKPVIVIHHMIMAPIGFSLIVWYRNYDAPADYYVGILYLMEASTPFVSLRFILSKLKMKSSWIYAVNGVCMLIFFPICRIYGIFHGWILYSQQQNLSYLEAFWGIDWVWKMCFISSLLPQIYWYFLMWRGLFKMLKGAKSDGVKKE